MQIVTELYRESEKRTVNEFTPPEHAGWFADVRNIVTLAETTPGLPLPSISPDRITFQLGGIKHAEDTCQALAEAEVILAAAFGVEFISRDEADARGLLWHVSEAWLPSGTCMAITCRASHLAEIPVRERIQAQRDRIRQSTQEVFEASRIGDAA